MTDDVVTKAHDVEINVLDEAERKVKLEATGMAVFSPCETFRYYLMRRWSEDEDPKSILWVMLNPSTADERILDPTVRRCVGYSYLWGYNHMQVCNIFALRATDPKKLYAAEDPIGPLNDDYLAWAAEGTLKGGGLVMAGWGTHGKLNGRSKHVIRLLSEVGDLHALSMTKAGHPGHPLYLGKNLRPTKVEWSTL